jgi:hypothetical protein
VGPSAVLDDVEKILDPTGEHVFIGFEVFTTVIVYYLV